MRPAVEALEDRTVPATFNVTNLSDGGGGSLRDAITRSNASPDADTIVFDPSIRGGTIALSDFVNPPGSFPIVPQPAGPSAFVIISPITIQRTGETLARVGAIDFRLFQVTAAGTLTLQNLTLRDGRAMGGTGGGGGAAGMGGAIYNQGVLSAIGCTLFNNQAIGGTSGVGVGGGGGGLGESLSGGRSRPRRRGSNWAPRSSAINSATSGHPWHTGCFSQNTPGHARKCHASCNLHLFEHFNHFAG
jgi:hypothetical protein